MSAVPAYDPSPLAERLEFLGLDRAALDRISKLSPFVLPHIEPALTRFYVSVARTPETASFFSDTAQMDHAMSKQAIHWQRIAKGRIDEDYFHSSTVIGERHAR